MLLNLSAEFHGVKVVNHAVILNIALIVVNTTIYVVNHQHIAVLKNS